MKRFAFALTAAALAFSALSFAADVTDADVKVCGDWGRFAELAMKAHQKGKSLTEQMALSPDPRAYDLTLTAYNTERFASEPDQERAVTSYRDKVAAECLTSLSNPDGVEGVRPLSFWTVGRQ